MRPPKVGVVIPAYNAERYLGECVASALAQDWPNLRVYVLDDASTDRTGEVISSLASKYPELVAWSCRKQNKGESITRQEVTEMALDDGCQYVAPLDADDLRKPNTLSGQIEALEENPEMGVCYGKTDFINWRGELHVDSLWELFGAVLKGQPQGEVWDHLIAYGKIGTMDTIVIREEVARACRYDPSFRYYADIDYLAQIATLPRLSGFVAVNKVVASYRFHAHQADSRIDQKDLGPVLHSTMCTVAFRIFHRLEEQGRGVSAAKRRNLWRILIFRTMLAYLRRKKWRASALMAKDFLMPLTCLESKFRSYRDLDQLRVTLGVWAH